MGISRTGEGELKISRTYDVVDDCFYLTLWWDWKTRADKPNAPEWWSGGYSRFRKLLPLAGVWYRFSRFITAEGMPRN